MTSLMSKKFMIFAHYAGTGNTEELRDWLIRKKAREVVYVAFPFEFSKHSVPELHLYRNGILVQKVQSRFVFKKPMPLAYIRDFFLGLYWGVRYGRGTDFFAGGDNLLVLCGLLLRFLGCVRLVAYYMIDYSPVRYQNRSLNALYWSFDRFAAYHANVVWPIAEPTIEGRFASGKLDRSKVRWDLVPYGTGADRYVFPSAVSVSTVVYMGGLLKNKGPELFVPLVRELAKRLDDFRFIILGGGPYLEPLKREIAEADLERYVEVRGYIENFEEIENCLLHSGVAIAPYYPFDKNNHSFFADAGKLKVYMGCALPVVATEVPLFARTIHERGAGRLASYDAADFADKICEIMKDHAAYRAQARLLGMEYSWDKILTDAFRNLVV